MKLNTATTSGVLTTAGMAVLSGNLRSSTPFRVGSIPYFTVKWRLGKGWGVSPGGTPEPASIAL